MKLQTKIQRSMIMIVIVTLFISLIATTIIVYRQNLNFYKEELRKEADYMIEALELSNGNYLDRLDAVQRDTRVTVIDKDGDVIYDYNKDAYDVNHGKRPEVVEARERGEGSAIRHSDILGIEQFYYARLLKDGNVFRVSTNINTVVKTSLMILPVLMVIMIIMIALAWFISKKIVKHIIAPINSLNVRQPLQNEIYEELNPLLVNMDEQNKEKEAIANMRKEFTANVSHELKTPLTSISGYAELLQNGLVKEEDVSDFAGRIYKESNRMITLVNDIMEISRLEEAAVSIQEPMDLFKITKECVNRLMESARKRNIHMEMTGENVTYIGSEKAITEIVQNIIDNAIKYNVEKGRVDIWVGKTLEGIKIIVTDTGIGIPKEDLERVFERFYRVDKSHSKEVDGTGLGLSIVKHSAIMHDIKINISSEILKGTKVELTF